jgi:hypothetical protein
MIKADPVVYEMPYNVLREGEPNLLNNYFERHI